MGDGGGEIRRWTGVIGWKRLCLELSLNYSSGKFLLGDNVMPKCEVCDKSFDTERGKNVHKTQVHGRREQEHLVILELINEGRRTVSDMAEKLGWDEDKIRRRLNELKDREFVQKSVEKSKEMTESSREAVYELTERGRKEIPELMGELAEETRSFLENISESFREHLGPLMPKISVKWPKKRKKDGK